MKRFLEDVVDECDLDIMDQRALDEANRRLGMFEEELTASEQKELSSRLLRRVCELAEPAQPKSGIIRHLGAPVIEVTLVATEGNMNGIPQLGGV